MAMQQFVMRSGNTFMLEGRPFYLNGWNSYWLMVNAALADTQPRVDAILRDGAALGLTLCRTWAFNDDSYLALQTLPGTYDEKVFKVSFRASSSICNPLLVRFKLLFGCLLVLWSSKLLAMVLHFPPSPSRCFSVSLLSIKGDGRLTLREVLRF